MLSVIDKDQLTLVALKTRAREAEEAYASAFRELVRTMTPSDAIVDCHACDNVFIVPLRGKGFYGWVCPCGADDLIAVAGSRDA